MALITEAALRAEAARLGFQKSSQVVLNEVVREQFSTQKAAARSYDVFLSHSRLDSDFVLGLKLRLERAGCSVYVDWIDDPALDRSNVSPATADQLRSRMRSCKALLYAFSLLSSHSKWMPWELGYFDALRGKVAVVPLSGSSGVTSFNGQEYLGLYPYLDETKGNGTAGLRLWVNQDAKTYVLFEKWLTGTLPAPHP